MKTPDRRAVMLSLCTWNKNNESLHHHAQYVNDLNQIRYMIWSYWNMFSEEKKTDANDGLKQKLNNDIFNRLGQEQNAQPSYHYLLQFVIDQLTTDVIQEA